MRYADLIDESCLCTACNGSGQIMASQPVCEKCNGYGSILESVTPIKKKLMDCLVESMSMSDLSYIIDNIRRMSEAECIVDEDNCTVWLRFVLDSEYGSIWLKPRRDGTDLKTKFIRKLTAAARSQMGGQRPKSFAHVKSVLTGKIRNNAIKILTNTQEWEVVGLRWIDFKFGIS